MRTSDVRRNQPAAVFLQDRAKREQVAATIQIPGRAYARPGDNAKARTAYQDFFTLEIRRPRRRHPEASHGRIREVAVVRSAKRPNLVAKS